MTDLLQQLRGRDEVIAFHHERKTGKKIDRPFTLEGLAADEIARLTERCAALESALQQIERWDGFPETGEFWDKSKKDPISYGAQFGSNGERDFMRGIARAALSIHKTGGE